jgi:threonine dehydrogenase-like Zn-dependent dehydrogenase
VRATSRRVAQGCRTHTSPPPSPSPARSVNLRGGQLWAQKYWRMILGWIVEGRVSCHTWLATHVMPLADIKRAYAMFDSKEDRCLKIVLKPAAPPVAPGAAGVPATTAK